MNGVERFEREVVFTVKRASVEVSADTATFLEEIARREGKAVSRVVEEMAWAKLQAMRATDPGPPWDDNAASGLTDAQCANQD
jgi:hypothetical protein